MAVIAFVGLKLTFWANAVSSLGLMRRRIGGGYWHFTPLEVIIALGFSVSLAVLIVWDSKLAIGGPVRTTLSISFGMTGIAYLAYMARRVWQTSEPDG